MDDPHLAVGVHDFARAAQTDAARFKKLFCWRIRREQTVYKRKYRAIGIWKETKSSELCDAKHTARRFSEKATARRI